MDKSVIAMWSGHQVEVLGASRRNWPCLLLAESEWIRMISGSSQNCRRGWRAWLGMWETCRARTTGWGRPQGEPGVLPWALLPWPLSASCMWRVMWSLFLAEVRPLSLGSQAPQEEQVAGIFGYCSTASPSPWDSPIGGFPSTGRMLKSEAHPLPCASLTLQAAWGHLIRGSLRAPFWASLCSVI